MKTSISKFLLVFFVTFLVSYQFFSLQAQETTKPDSVVQKDTLVVVTVDSVTQAKVLKDSVKTAEQKQKKETKSVKEQAEQIKDALPIRQIIYTILLVLVTVVVVKAFTYFLDLMAERFTTYRITLKGMIPIVRIVVWLTAIYVVIVAIFHPTQESLLAFTASAGIAIGFASQDILQNIFGGILIIMDKPFQVGDKIQVGEHYGEVVNMGLRTVRIVTPDDNLVSVPNSKVINDSVSNANAGALDCQVVTTLYLPGNVDVQKAKQIALDAAFTSKYVFLEKPVVVLVQDEFDHIFLTKLKVKAYVHDIRYEAALASDITEIAKKEFILQKMLPENQFPKSEES